MALGIDIYQKYQTVTDWAKVKGSGVTFVYIKGTDGGGLAPVRADTYVKGVKGIGLPVGLYHYAELTPSPEAQADVLTAEVRRLGASGMPPALDLESPFAPNSAARAFAQRFLNRLRANGFSTVVLYANTSMLTGINADTLGVPGVKIWAANYGANDGTRHTYSYKGHVDIHQYTSAGRVPGITGSIDMNESLNDVTNTEDTMSADDAYNGFVKLVKDMRDGHADDIKEALQVLVWTTELAVPVAPENPTAEARLAMATQRLQALETDVSQVKQAIGSVQPGGVVDLDALADKILSRLGFKPNNA